MKRAQTDRRVDMRGFRWSLEPVERSLHAALERDRLALASLQRQAQALDQAAQARLAEQREEEGRALQCALRDVRAGAQAMRYLAGLEAARRAADAQLAQVGLRMAAARLACADRQRQLESAQALRHEAQRQHALAQLRRQWKEADAAWLACRPQRSAIGVRETGQAR